MIPMSDTTMNSNIDSATSEATVSNYFALLKPRVMSLVVFTGIAGMWVAPGVETMHPILLFVAILCLAVGAGAAGAINMWYDRDIDAIMNRTKTRPIPAGQVVADEAVTFGIVLSIASVMLMGLALNWLAAGILAFASLFYVFIYTMWLKRTTPQNIVIGGAAGAFPPMIGWAAITGDIQLFPLILFAIIFIWTPPHFWALSLFANKDYKAAKIPMMAVVKGEKSTKIQMLLYTILLLPIAVSPYILGYAGMAYGVVSGALSLLFIYAAILVLKDKNLEASNFKTARLMFGYSIFYLFAIFLAVMML